MNTDAKIQNELVQELYNRVENGILYANYNGHTTTPDVKKYALESLTRFFTAKISDKHWIAVANTLLTGADYKAKPKFSVMIKKAMEFLSETNLFTKNIKPTMQGLTISEATVMEFLCNELAQWRFDEPGYSCVDSTEVTAYLKKIKKDWNVKSTAGVISSLSKKGYLNIGEDDFKNILYPQWHRVPKSFPSTMTVQTAIKPKSMVKVVDAKSSKSSEKASTLAASVKKSIITSKPKADKKISIEVSIVPPVVTKGKKTVKKIKLTPEQREVLVSEALSSGKKYKPFAKFGAHGENSELKEFVAGDPIIFSIKGENFTGEYVHFHTNNHSPNGYVVIRYDGKIYERVLSKVSAVVSTKVVDVEVKGSKVVDKVKQAQDLAKLGAVLFDIAVESTKKSIKK